MRHVRPLRLPDDAQHLAATAAGARLREAEGGGAGRPGEGTGTVGMALLPPSGPNPSRPGQAVASCFAQVQLWSHARREVVAKLSMGPPFWKAPSCKRHCEALGFRLP